jgi:hypothetical protein
MVQYFVKASSKNVLKEFFPAKVKMALETFSYVFEDLTISVLNCEYA